MTALTHLKKECVNQGVGAGVVPLVMKGDEKETVTKIVALINPPLPRGRDSLVQLWTRHRGNVAKRLMNGFPYPD